MARTQTRKRRLIIVANRLPFAVTGADGSYEYRETTGGLVTGLSSYLSTIASNPENLSEYLWVAGPERRSDRRHARESPNDP